MSDTPKPNIGELLKAFQTIAASDIVKQVTRVWEEVTDTVTNTPGGAPRSTSTPDTGVTEKLTGHLCPPDDVVLKKIEIPGSHRMGVTEPHTTRKALHCARCDALLGYWPWNV